MWKFIIGSALVATLVVVASARAAYGDPRLDAVATSVAGHPVQVSCGSTPTDWAATEAANHSVEADGFTFIGQVSTTGAGIIYLAPRICDTLEALLSPYHDDVGPYWASLAIKTIIHESIHQRGVTDESVTDCTALTLVQQYAVSSFGYPATVSTTTLVKKTVVVRVARVVRKVTTYVPKTVTVPNPALAELQADAVAWHHALPPVYQTQC